MEGQDQADHERSGGAEYRSNQNGGSKNVYSSTKSVEQEKMLISDMYQTCNQDIRGGMIERSGEEDVKLENSTDQAQGRDEDIPHDFLEQAAIPRSTSPLMPRFRSRMTTKEQYLKNNKTGTSVWVVPESLKHLKDHDKTTGFNFPCKECINDPTYAPTKKLFNRFTQ